MNINEFKLRYFLIKRRSMLQFYLLKFLKYEDIVKFSLVSKDAGRLCEANNIHSDDFDFNEIKIVNVGRYLMLLIAL
jgi:hypothetical protein